MRERISPSLAARRSSTQIRLMTEAHLTQAFSDRTVFASHLAREGKVVVDRDGVTTALLNDYPKDAPVKESAEGLYSQWQVYSDLAWCGGQYLFCFADLYAWGRSGSMLALARDGNFEFDRDEVFRRLGATHPELQQPARVIRRLRPFWEIVNRRGTPPVPFPAEGSHEEAAAARDACREILSQSL